MADRLNFDHKSIVQHCLCENPKTNSNIHKMVAGELASSAACVVRMSAWEAAGKTILAYSYKPSTECMD